MRKNSMDPPRGMLNGSPMRDRSDNTQHHERMLYHRAISHSRTLSDAEGYCYSGD